MKSQLYLNNVIDQTSLTKEAFRVIRTKILYSKLYANTKSLLFTSAGAGEGKSMVVINTAITLAQTGKKVIILDCDLRNPSQHKLFVKPNIGLTNFFDQPCSINNIVQDTGIHNLQLVTSGPIPANPAELLDSNQLTEILSLLCNRSDYLLIDSPPVLPVTDACILGSKADGILLVVSIGKVRPEMLQRAKAHLEEANGNLLGLIINRSELYSEQRAYYHYYENIAKTAN
ncbi:CpsD/CapB family tyrosine-protein kinase [Sporomusa acidovorans]|uniref:non-specific protein-tyrosine kinase n=1 Tax=Sporomusa acidovorans (strain ATCC 49682 / DSM 3132 / Mol) TaxID=1123286 RepID=A0ABZ3IYI5_SPOA4|nr:CpsD/CapB family tyrosine-protein kinase [Sporomusa acidovorans]OZC17232.1 tyrosine-protein kinase YwqD [Sporomusa acidovorans DSM 3132]SDF15288.1 capsular exopolysaccharide family [Sporomusa acidovorans]